LPVIESDPQAALLGTRETGAEIPTSFYRRVPQWVIGWGATETAICKITWWSHQRIKHNGGKFVKSFKGVLKGPKVFGFAYHEVETLIMDRGNRIERIFLWEEKRRAKRTRAFFELIKER